MSQISFYDKSRLVSSQKKYKHIVVEAHAKEAARMIRTWVRAGLFLLLFLGALQLVITEFERYFHDEDAVTVSSFKSEEELRDEMLPQLEMFLVGREEVDGYMVETYREYEIIKDSEGKLIQKTATENYEYIRYKQ
jgi:hypothetical protein